MVAINDTRTVTPSKPVYHYQAELISHKKVKRKINFDPIKQAVLAQNYEELKGMTPKTEPG